MPKYDSEFKMPKSATAFEMPKLNANFDPEFFAEDAAMYAEEFIDCLADLPGTEAIDQVWAENISALPAAERKAVAAALNDEFHALLEDEALVRDIRLNGAEAVKQQIKEEAAADANDAAALLDIQMLSRAIIRTCELRGDKASPLVKAFAEAAKKSPGLEAFTKPLYAVVDAIARNLNKPAL